MASFCRSCLLFLVYALVPLLAILAYFHIQCTKEKELKQQNKLNNVFDPDSTDVKDYCMSFPRIGLDKETYVGVSYMLMQWAPCAFVKIVNFLFGSKTMEELAKEAEQSDDFSKHNVTFIDARKSPPGTFFETGFTLIELDEEPLTTDWRSNPQYSEDAEVKLFQKQMEPYVRNLYPDANNAGITFHL